MKDVIDVAGASGATYRFRRLESASGAPATAGNFVYLRWDGDTPVFVYFGEADTLAAIQTRWGEAQAKHQATDTYYRLNVSREVRHRERDDMLVRVQPAMNRGKS